MPYALEFLNPVFTAGEPWSTVRKGLKWANRLNPGQRVGVKATGADREIGSAEVVATYAGPLGLLPAVFYSNEHDLTCRTPVGLVAALERAYGELGAEVEELTVTGILFGPLCGPDGVPLEPEDKPDLDDGGATFGPFEGLDGVAENGGPGISVSDEAAEDEFDADDSDAEDTAEALERLGDRDPRLVENFGQDVPGGDGGPDDPRRSFHVPGDPPPEHGELVVPIPVGAESSEAPAGPFEAGSDDGCAFDGGSEADPTAASEDDGRRGLVGLDDGDSA